MFKRSLKLGALVACTLGLLAACSEEVEEAPPRYFDKGLAKAVVGKLPRDFYGLDCSGRASIFLDCELTRETPKGYVTTVNSYHIKSGVFLGRESYRDSKYDKLRVRRWKAEYLLDKGYIPRKSSDAVDTEKYWVFSNGSEENISLEAALAEVLDIVREAYNDAPSARARSVPNFMHDGPEQKEQRRLNRDTFEQAANQSKDAPVPAP